MRVAESLPELREFSIDGNPCNANSDLKCHIIMRLDLELLNDEKITQLERDVAEQFYRKSKIELPSKKRTTEETAKDVSTEETVARAEEGAVGVKENKDPRQLPAKGESETPAASRGGTACLEKRKSVRWRKDVDEDGLSWQDHEIQRLERLVADLLAERDDLKSKLQKERFDRT